MTGFAVTIDTEDVSADPIRNQISQALKGHGITVLAPGAYPAIVVTITTNSASVSSSGARFSAPTSVAAYSVIFGVVRLVPVGAKFMVVTTNDSSILGMSGVLSLRSEIETAVDHLLKTFFENYAARRR